MEDIIEKIGILGVDDFLLRNYSAFGELCPLRPRLRTVLLTLQNPKLPLMALI